MLTRDEIKGLVNELCFAFNQPEMDDLMENVRYDLFGDAAFMLRGVLTPEQIRPVYDYLRESYESPDIDLVEVTKGQWSSLPYASYYIARMGKTVTKLRPVGRWWLFGDMELDSLEGIQQIWKAVVR